MEYQTAEDLAGHRF